MYHAARVCRLRLAEIVLLRQTELISSKLSLRTRPCIMAWAVRGDNCPHISTAAAVLIEQ